MLARLRRCRWHVLRGFCDLPHVGPYAHLRFAAALAGMVLLACMLAAPLVGLEEALSGATGAFFLTAPPALIWLAAGAIDRSRASDARVVQERFDLLICTYTDAHGWNDESFVWEIHPPTRGQPLRAAHVVAEGKRTLTAAPELLAALARATVVEGRPLWVDHSMRGTYTSMVLGGTMSAHARLAARALFDGMAQRVTTQADESVWADHLPSPHHGQVLSLKI